MKLHDLRPAPGSHKARTRVGRGIAAGKASCVAACIQRQPGMNIEELRFQMERVADLKNEQMEAPWTPLND